MTRTEQLRTCRKCSHINFDIKKGFICSLTNNYAVFNTTCNTFQEATFVSNKKVLKPSQLTVLEKAKSNGTIKTVKKVVSIILLITIGFMMIDDPSLFSTNQQEITDSFARKVMNLIWGIPAGLIAISVGFILALRIVSKKTTSAMTSKFLQDKSGDNT